MPSLEGIMLASWEPDCASGPNGPCARRIRCLVDLDAGCNMACPRCRRARRGRRLDRADAVALVEALAEAVIASGARSAVAAFYGGEPLLECDQLLALAGALREPLHLAGITSQLGLVTNGTRLDATTVVRLVNAGFTRVSVTVAGTRDQHDLRRRLPGGSSYRSILDNLRVATELMGVVVRYELREDMDLVRLPDFVADLRVRGLLRGPRRIEVVAQPPRSYARQGRDLFDDRLRIAPVGETVGAGADP